MPKRSTFVGGPPQFGQFKATGPCWPAGTIGCWIGGGGGIVRRLAPCANTMTKMMITKRMGTHKKGAAENIIELDPPTKAKMITAKTPSSTTTSTIPMTIASGGRPGPDTRYGPRGGGCGGGADWTTPPERKVLR